MKIQDTTAVSSVVATDLSLIIEANPESFDVVLFKADSTEKETVAIGDDVVGSLESNERRIAYAAPVVVAALEPTVDIIGYPMLSAGGGYGLQQDQGPYKLLIAGVVPKQSVVAFPVAQHDGTHVVRVMYVLSAETLGRKAPAGYVYTLIPYVGGDSQIENVTPDKSSIIQYVAGLLESLQIPDVPDMPDIDEPKEPIYPAEPYGLFDSDQVGSL